MSFGPLHPGLGFLISFFPKKEPNEEMTDSKVGAVCVSTDNSVFFFVLFCFFYSNISACHEAL